MDLTLQEQIAEIAFIQGDYGIHLITAPGGAQGYIPEQYRRNMPLAMDAMPALVTVSNSGVPAFMTNYVDSKLIEVMVSPLKAVQILGETKKGDWTTQTAWFSMIESTGEVSSYSDRNANGEVDSNANWPQRQQYLYQTVTQWGDLQQARMGLAGIDWASRQNISSGKIMHQFENRMYFYGIAGLQNYGILNDPGLSTPLTPAAKAAGGFTWATATYLEIIIDINKLFTQAVLQSGGILTRETPMKLCLASEREVYLSTVQALSSNASVREYISKTYPGMTTITAPQYATGSGQLVQLIVDELDGQKTGECAFGEKMRAHGVVRELSAFREKKSGGGYGAIFYNYVGVSQMLGI